ncbi:hypothetical protein [Qipengyuania sp. MTN3-11]|uniref:hypothetical protein n=1 Tax=Qipengyuania sp. MTN3-11 TaxID=3056557 RepID=UPI0036F37617
MSKKSGLSKPMEEAQRRAAILRRYDAEPLRTGEDDERFAKELGVAVQTFHQLIRSWRRYREPKMLPGARTRATAADREAAIDAAAKPDLSNVDPARRPLVRKRIKVLRRYLALETPTPVDEAAAAEELGMSLGSFHRLRRSWTMSRDPATLPGGSTPATLKDRRRPAIGAQAEACIAAVIEDLGPQATTVSACADVCIGRNNIIGQTEITRGQFEVIFSGKPSNKPIASAPNNPYHISVLASARQTDNTSVSVLSCRFST